MLKTVGRSIKKYYNFRNLLAFLLLEASLIFVSILLVQSADRLTRNCKTAHVSLTGKLEGGLSKVYTLDYSGNGSCYLLVFRGSSDDDNTSLWLYKPNGSIEILGEEAAESKNSLLLADIQNGKYRVSVRNKSKAKQIYDITLLLATK